MTTARCHLLISVISVVTLSACGSLELAEQWGQRESTIVQGTNDSAHPSAAFITYVKGNSGYMCTGTLIGTKTVITAGHCFDATATYAVELGGKSYEVAKALAHPQYSTTGEILVGDTTYQGVALNDVSILVLKEEVQDVTPMKIATQQPALGSSITIVGFGLTAASQTNSGGTKRVAQTKISQVTAEYFLYGLATDPSGGNTCYGDSGGPTYILENGQERLLGVHSMGDTECKEYGYDMMARRYASWLAQESGGNFVETSSTPPTVTIKVPKTSSTVPTSFQASVEVKGESPVVAVELFVDGVSMGKKEKSPATYNLTGLEEGPHLLKAEAMDQNNGQGAATLNVTVKDDSKTISEPVDNQPTSPFSEMDPGSNGSSGGTVLVEGGCSVAGGQGSSPWILALLLLGLVQRWRRR
jgi:MYXO-CTERM domain-containing protein